MNRNCTQLEHCSETDVQINYERKQAEKYVCYLGF